MNSDAVRDFFYQNDNFINDLGVELANISPEYAEASLKIQARHLNCKGQVHGGVIMAFVDVVFGAAANADGFFCVNAQSSISFLNPGQGPLLRGVARAIHRGNKLATYEVDVLGPEDILVARATISGYRLKHKHSFAD